MKDLPTLISESKLAIGEYVTHRKNSFELVKKVVP
jgi:hypothetical protein